MTSVPSHFWLEIQPAGEDARQARQARPEDRDFLVALGSRPSRVLDVFRRLRWADGQAFQDTLARAIARGWVQARDQSAPAFVASPVPVLPPQDVPEPPSSPDDSSLMALLARYAQRVDENAQLVVDVWEDADAADPSGGHPSGSNWDLPDVDDLDAATGDGGDASALAPPASESTQDTPVEPEGPLPWERLPPSPPPSPQDAASLLEAMGLSPDVQAPLGGVAAPAPDSAPPASGSDRDALLQALLAGAPAPSGPALVDVPAYGIGAPSTASASAGAYPPTPSDGFVRLRDVGAVHGPGDGPSSGGASTPTPGVQKAPEGGPGAPAADPGPQSERTQRRMRDRQRMLEAARREAEDRRRAKERAAAIKHQQEAGEEQRQEQFRRNRVHEAAERGASLKGRAERARRIRDGLDPDGNPKDGQGHQE